MTSRSVNKTAIQNGEYERMKSKDVEMLFYMPNIRLFLKAKRLEWAGFGELSKVLRKKRLNQKSPQKKRSRGKTSPEDGKTG